ncbi:FAD dependent oxidoreductase [Serendipita vermifera]|nr:FAD dependent oxidoreductase [Serendipita vermifera]
MSHYPLPVDSYANFDAFFISSDFPGPAPLPVSNPTKAFWTHPGLSSDWQINPNDPEGNKNVNPYAKEGSEGPLTDDADIVIIGSGITGISIALELGKLVREAKNGSIKVVILEARDFCSGATGRNGGHLTASTCHNFTKYSARYDLEEVKRCFAIEKHTVSSLLNLIEESGWAKDVDLIEGGHNELLASSDEVDEGKADWRKAVDAGIIKENDVTWFTPEEAKITYGTCFDVFRGPGHNLWPLRLVTKMFELARDGESLDASQGARDANSSTQPTSRVHEPQDTNKSSYTSSIIRMFSNIIPSTPKSAAGNQETTQDEAKSNIQDQYRLILHTHTPVHSVKPNNQVSGRKWTVETNRGTVHTDTVVYATNAYTSHLLPQLAGPKGIIPVRGQVAAVRARVGYVDEGWKEKDGVIGLTRSGWGGNQGFEYWFPRPHPCHPSATPTQTEEGEPIGNAVPNERLRRPLVILGGARETLKDKGYGMYETDDSKLDAEVSAGLRRFLHSVFPGQYSANDLESVSKNIEVEWTGIMGFTESGDPFVGRVKDANGTVVRGQYLSAGYTGHGMPRASGCAQALASLIWHDIKHPDKDWTIPDWLPLHYLTQSPEGYLAEQSNL